jgi:nucleoside-diphosphate-sugar epimerase
MKLAILGATSQIAKDLISLFSLEPEISLSLFARNQSGLNDWLLRKSCTSRLNAESYADFEAAPRGSFDMVLNFVGSGNPALTASLGKEIWDITQQFDAMALSYIDKDPACRYIFISSGAIFGGDFSKPVTADTGACVLPNSIHPDAWYGLAKLNAEISHRRYHSQAIVDVRVFNYFSHTSDIHARFLITDALRSIQTKTTFRTTKSNIWRDYVGPLEIAQIVKKVINSPPQNVAIDCFSKSPIDKISVLKCLQDELCLRYEFVDGSTGLSATGNKTHYYSKSRLASQIFGYLPESTALEIVIEESQKLLSYLERTPS